ncbi:MAG TPA: hypothetical protein VNA20_04390 [Frankiaceae bacterium]|nr:hypothetical protein [Frankiaceae bacterium]
MYRAVALALLLSACAGGDPAGDAAKPCDGLLEPADPSVTLPPRLPAGVADPVFYKTQRAGATTLWFAHASGDDVVVVRDAIAGTFESAGFTIESRDEEPPAEAEFQFTAAKDEGSVQVTPLCAGRVTVRWRLGPR